MLLFNLLMVWSAHAETKISCDYSFMGTPMASVEATILDDGTPGPSVLVTMHGRQHSETATAEARAADEYAHLWISKENPDNAIEMIVYHSPRPQGRSVLINHKMPMGRELWGDCRGL